MSEQVMVVLKRNEISGFGFSLLGTTDLPHVIYDIVENSPAAECGLVEAGDIIVKVNGIDVHRYSTKEVLKCLRLSTDSVTLELKRDPLFKAHIKEHLARFSTFAHLNTPHKSDSHDISETAITCEPDFANIYPKNLADATTTGRKSRIPTPVKKSPVLTASSNSSKNNSIKTSTSQIPTANGHNVTTKPNESDENISFLPGKARFEAYMMTGDLILNLSRTPQSDNLIAMHAKKIDSLRESPQKFTPANGALAPKASGESTPSSSPTISDESECSVRNKIKFEKIPIGTRKECRNNWFQTSCDNNRVSCDTKNTYHSDEHKKCVRGGGDDDYENLKTYSGFISPSSSSINKPEIVCGNIPKESSTKRIQEREYNRQSRSSSSSATIRSGELSSTDTNFSAPASPLELTMPQINSKESSNSAPTSPDQSMPEVIRRQHNGIIRKCDAAGFRTSKSEDHLQQIQRDGLGTIIPIDIDEDINSSLNTLLDTRQDSDDSQIANCERIVWTYNAPVSSYPNTATSPNSHYSSISSSPQRSDSPTSPTSVSSSVMSSNSGSKGAVGGSFCTNKFLSCPTNGDQSVSEAISNISSPDYQDDDNLLSSKDLGIMGLSDPSDSDSTILVSDAIKQRKHDILEGNHRVIIKVKCDGNKQIGQSENSLERKDLLDDPTRITEDLPTILVGGFDIRDTSPPVSDDGSDVDSLHSYHYSPKAVDIPSAIRLAKRLYYLDGFKKSDVSRHLCKNNDFSRAVADEYLNFFNFDKQTLDESLRTFLQKFALSGETQERERVLVHFSKRYLDCNPRTINSQDAVHTLTCAIMLLNTDLHGPNIGRKMSCAEFIDNLVELNDGENFPKDVLKHLYQSIKSQPLEWALDEDCTDLQKINGESTLSTSQVGANPFLDSPQSTAAIEYKKGYVMRKCCYDSNYKKTPFGKRSWKMFYCTLRDLVLYLHKDEHGFRKSQMSDNVHNAIRIHHSVATKATDYTKKQHVFRLRTADQSEFLFQTSDSKELLSWIETINFVCAAFSAPPLEAGVGSQKRFQRPLLPSTQTKLIIREQLSFHEHQVTQIGNALIEHKLGPVPNKGLPLQNYREKESYLQYELRRYNIYVNILSTRLATEQQVDLQGCSLVNIDDRFSAHHTAQNLGDNVLQDSTDQPSEGSHNRLNT